MDKLRAMQTFVRIVEAGSLTRAADRCDTSLTAVVRTLAALESELNLRLLHRTTRRIALTEEGKRYLESCRRVLADVEEAEQALKARHVEPVGVLRITAPVLFGHMHVAPAVTRFVQRYERVQCKLTMLDRIVNLLEEGMDVGVRIGHLDDSSLVAQKVGTVRRVVVASPAYLRKHGTPAHPRELVRHSCVLLSTALGGNAWPFREGNKNFRVEVSGPLEFNQSAAAVEACAQGMGFGIFLSYQVAPYVANKRLRIVLEDYEEALRPVNLVYPSARLLPSRMRVFIDWMKEDLKGAWAV